MAKASTARLLGGLAFGGLALVASVPLFAGCGGASNGYGAFASDAGGGGGAIDSTTGGSSGGSSSGSSDDAPSGCNVACATDNDCAGSCPSAASGSSNCCDLSSGTCFLASSSTCPSVPDSAVE
jgi:hypothetical protein